MHDLFRAIQTLDSYSRMIFAFGAHCNDRLIFRDFPMYQKLLRRLQQVFTYKWICTVNSTESAGAALQGVGASLKLMRVDNLEATVKALNAPTGCSTILYVDLLLRQYNKESSGQNDPSLALVRLLHSFLKHHFETEMKTSNNNLNSLQVYVTKNEIDDAEVIRIMLSYKKLVNIDKFLEFLIIPYKIHELINILVVDFRSNVDLQDLCTHNKLQSLNEVFSCAVRLFSTIMQYKSI